jgi:hypothetical protein
MLARRLPEYQRTTEAPDGSGGEVMNENQIGEIRFEELHENDTLVVETAHNVYSFRVRDTRHQMGELRGGKVGTANQAVLGGTMEDDSVVDDRLKVGGRALFFSSTPGDVSSFQRIITSPIAKIRIERPRAA